MTRLLVGVDTGGTFTDLVVFDVDTHAVRALKTSSTPEEPGQAIMNALAEGEVPGSAIEHFSHGTTVGTNALIERKGCKVAFLTTQGFEDTPYIQRINRKVLYDLQWQKPRPLVAGRSLCLGVDERLASDGSTIRGVDRQQVRDLCAHIRQSGAEAVAVSLLFSYLNTGHEEQVREVLREELDGLPISLSHEIAPIWREYERASTTIADAYLKPLLDGYVASLREALQRAGFHRGWTVMKSNGGIMDSEAAAASPVQTVQSGPAAGMIASQRIAASAGFGDVLTIDMGGTSADVGIVVGGEQRHTTEYEIEWGLPAAVPLIDIKSVGAGGGSIAWVDAGGFLRAGPQSAGAKPGPVSYGRGGTEVTVTDANLALGRLNPDYFLGGRMQLQPCLADGPMDDLAARVRMDRVQLADAILEIANENMASAIKMISIERGLDPRRFTLVAFGGAGPLHATAIARRMGIPRVVVPPLPGVFSALGLLLADLRVDKVWTQASSSITVDADTVDRQFQRITQHALDELRREGFTGEPEIRRAIYMRYLGQNYEHEVDIPNGQVDEAMLAGAFDRFNEIHAQRYGYSIQDEVIELVSFRVTAIGSRATPSLDLISESVRAHGPTRRPVHFRGLGFVETEVVHRSELRRGQRRQGPLLIEEEGSTTVVEPATAVEVGPAGALLISLEGES